MSSAWVIPSVASPALAGIITRYLGWRWVFGGLIPFTIIAGGMAVPAVRALGRSQTALDAADDTVDAADDPSRPGTVLPSLVLVVGATGVIAGFGFHQPVLAVVLGVAGLVVTAGAFHRLTPEGTLRARPGIPATVLTRGVLTFAFFATDSFVSLFLQSIRHTGRLYSSVAYAAASFTWTGGSWIQARSSRTRSASQLNQLGLLTVGIGAAVMALVVMTDVPTWLVVLAWAVGGLGIGLAYPQQALVVLSTAPPSQEGFSTAALQLSDVLGVAIGSGIGGVIITTSERWGHGLTGGLTVVFWMSVAASLVGVALAQRMPHAPMAPVEDPGDEPRAADAAAVASAVLEESGRQGI
jgi:predicted MFS family arabinose efflux permease